MQSEKKLVGKKAVTPMKKPVLKKAKIPKEIKWEDYIDSIEGKLGGKPCIKGTRLSVDFILGLLGAGWKREDILEGYELKEEQLRAVFLFVRESLEDFGYIKIPQ